MKFRIEREVLAEALGAVSRVASNRNAALPALSGVLFAVSGDRLVLTCTDGDMTIEFALPVGAQVDGKVVANARLVSDIVRSLADGRVEIALDGEQLVISSGRSTFTVPTFATSDFPAIPAAPAAETTMQTAALEQALRQVVRAASTDLQKLPLTAVLMSAEADGLKVVATDSFRLAVKTVAEPATFSLGTTLLLPARALTELQRVLSLSDEVGLSVMPERAVFRVGPVTLSTQLVAADFPRYQQLFQPSYPNKLEVEREALLEALRRARVLAKENTPVRLEMHRESLRLVVVTQDMGSNSEELDATLTGEELTIGFRSELLNDGIEAVVAERITIETTDPVKPAVVRGVGDDSYTYLLMPQRLSQ